MKKLLWNPLATVKKLFWNRQDWTEEWLRSQIAAMKAGNEIIPPWMAFPGKETWWSGWRQGYSEAWLCDVWLPFWQRLLPSQRENYLNRWNVPADWRDRLETFDRANN